MDSPGPSPVLGAGPTTADSNDGAPDLNEETSRLSRYGDWTSIQNFAQIPTSTSSRTLYHGLAVHDRMTAIREAITYIRTHWSDYSTFLEGLRAYLQKHGFVMVPTEHDKRTIDAVLTSQKEWIDRQPNTGPLPGDTYDVIRLYTSSFGYAQIFAMLNTDFRMDVLTDDGNNLRPAVFLVELLNIDLYNYVSAQPAANFQGIVYRGLSISPEQIQEFEDLAAKPPAERHWSIPLSMMSASTSVDVAVGFALADSKLGRNRHPFLWRIHVAELGPELSQIYRQRFPSSVVSSLCAVRIAELSTYKEEEVLLRGPWFQLLRLQHEEVGQLGVRMPVMDLVMLNSNRDHPSTMELGAVDDEARQLFASLVGMARSKVCANLATEWGLSDDAQHYNEMHKQQHKKVLDICNVP